jgi:hypothetical protein
MKLDLLTNATVVDDAIRFVSNRSNHKLKPRVIAVKVTKKQKNLIMMKTRIS